MLVDLTVVHVQNRLVDGILVEVVLGVFLALLHLARERGHVEARDALESTRWQVAELADAQLVIEYPFAVLNRSSSVPTLPCAMLSAWAAKA